MTSHDALLNLQLKMKLCFSGGETRRYSIQMSSTRENAMNLREIDREGGTRKLKDEAWRAEVARREDNETLAIV
jgi:hypothetical protein